jgi:hypothetical protein
MSLEMWPVSDHWPSRGWRVNEHGLSVEWYLPRNSRNTLPLYLPQTTHALSYERTRVCAARTCFTAGPFIHQSFQMKTYITFQNNSTNGLVAEFLPGLNNGFIAARRDHICCQIRICHVKILSQPFLHQNRYNWRVQRCASLQQYIVYKNVNKVIVNTNMQLESRIILVTKYCKIVQCGIPFRR